MWYVRVPPFRKVETSSPRKTLHLATWMSFCPVSVKSPGRKMRDLVDEIISFLLMSQEEEGSSIVKSPHLETNVRPFHLNIALHERELLAFFRVPEPVVRTTASNSN